MVNNIMLGALAWASSLKETVVNALTGDERGQDLVEYAVLVGGIAVVALVAILTLGTGQGTPLWNFADRIGACVQFDTAGCQGN